MKLLEGEAGMLRMPVQFIQNYRPNSHCTSPKILLQIIIKYNRGPVKFHTGAQYKNSKTLNLIINIKTNIIEHAKELNYTETTLLKLKYLTCALYAKYKLQPGVL